MRTPLQYLNDEGIFGWSCKYTLTHPWILVPELYRRTKWFIQRGYRGYSDRDTWSLDSYLNSWMPQAIRSLKVGFGYPIDIYTELFPEDDLTQMNSADSAIAHAKWHEILETIAMGFEAGKKMDNFDFSGATELNELKAQLDEGLRLFNKYYQNLWS